MVSLAKWLSVHLRTKWLRVRVQLQSLKLLLAGDEFTPEMILKQSGFTCSACELSKKIKKEYRNFKKHGIRGIFTKRNQIKFVFNMTWLMEVLKI